MSFLILHTQDGDQLIVPDSFLPEYKCVGELSDVHLPFSSVLVKLLVHHLIERHRCAGDKKTLDDRWFHHTLQTHQYVPMASLTALLRLSWANGPIVEHVAKLLRAPLLDWSQLEQTYQAWKRPG